MSDSQDALTATNANLTPRQKAKLQQGSQTGRIASREEVSDTPATTTNDDAEGGDPTTMTPGAQAALVKKRLAKNLTASVPVSITAADAALALSRRR